MSTRLAGTFEAGALTIAGAAPPGPGSRRPRCLLEGSIFNLAEIEGALGPAAAGGPEDVLLAAHRRWGEGMLGRLRGNFVLLVEDPTARTALLAGDQLGARSLFFRRTGATLTFATEVRDLIGLLPTRPGADEGAIVSWLAGGPTPAGRTLYEGVRRLGAGRLLRVSERGVETDLYWAPAYARTESLSLVAAGEAGREMLARAVRSHVPDADCGVLLSGGLDSTAVAALAKQRLAPGAPPRAYSAVFPARPSVDEGELIDAAADGIGLSQTKLSAHQGSVVAGSLRYLRDWELPPASPNDFLWQPLLQRAAADGVAVILDGEGGDELWSFSPYLLADRLRSGRIPSALRLARQMAGERYRGRRSLSLYLKLFGLKGAIPPSLHAALRRRQPPFRYAPGWLSERSAAIAFAEDDPWAWKKLDGPRWWAYMAASLTSAREGLGVGDYLRHRAAAAGLEARHPMIDLDLVEFALRLPPSLAMQTDLERPVLRRALASLVPDPIRLRPGKSYFNELFHDCLAGPDLPLIRELFSEPCEVAAYVDLESVRELLGRTGAKSGLGWPQAVWRLVTAECWLRAQVDSGSAERLLAHCAAGSAEWSIATRAPT